MSSYYEKILATGEVKCIDEEIPFEIPQGWEWCRVNEVATSVTDFVASGSFASLRENVKYYSTKEYALLVRTKDLSCNFSKDLVYTDKHGYDFLSNSNLFGGELILPNIGASIGKVFTVPNLNMPMTLAPNSVMIRLDDECTKSWLYNVFSSPFGYDTLWSISSSTAQGKFNKTDFRKVLVPIPPIEEQNRIVTKIKELSPYIEKYSKAQEHLDTWNVAIKGILQKSILQEAIQGKLVPQIASEGTAHELLEQIKIEKRKLVKEGKLKKSALNDSVIFRGDDNKYWEKKVTTCECIDEDIPFDVPESWAWVRLETILNTGSARRVHAKDWRQAGIPFYRAREIGKLADDGFVDNELYIDLSLYEDFSSSGVPLPNDLMITAVGTLGKVYIVKESDKFYYKDGSVLCLANKYGLCAEYLKMVIESPFFKGQYRQESQGTTVATLTMVRLQKYFIPIPPLQEQYRIVETYRNIASIMS